jgi:hypothetical protein
MMVSAICALALLAPLGPPLAAPSAPGAWTRSEAEKRAKADAAERAKVPEADVRVVESEERTWPDEGLGCSARKGLAEPSPVPGYRIVVAAGGTRFTYHADTAGRLARCDAPKKPLGPISK